ncbi:Transcription factor fungi [Macrophomina phaseolina MS6]|uniref:Transcription factor fungi n=1 Tax=Macrophomina phaseolina (strain MS6) TaxID=1126212 RepID=K2QN94_MACPH|nr:Transcription factor fungi [Macrophomina phaseolina MS6]
MAQNARNGLPGVTESTSSNSSAVDLRSPPMLSTSPADCISDLMRSDLDHLFFDRVYTFCPILSKRHYFSRARGPRAGEGGAFACLQHAMWTLAVSVSTQFQHIQEELYAHTRLMLERLESDPLQGDCVQIEQVQALALLAIYEYMRVGHRRGWMSAGQCLRYAVLLKLHNIDSIDGIAAQAPPALTWAEIEERRRTFWMAYTIDRFISLLDHLPLTFDQHVILTRLPAPEKEFQSDQPVMMDFLSELSLGVQPKAYSTFTEFIRLVTLCGQSLSHHQQGTVEHAYGCFSLEFWDRHQRLDNSLTQSIDSMSPHDPCALVFMDPMPLFTHMAAQAAVLLLYKASQTAPWDMEDYQGVINKYEARALAAAQQMVTLSKSLIELSHFKVHPFMPVLLYFCGDFLRTNTHLDPTFEMQAALQSALRGLVHVNKIAQDCLSRLEMQPLLAA